MVRALHIMALAYCLCMCTVPMTYAIAPQETFDKDSLEFSATPYNALADGAFTRERLFLCIEVGLYDEALRILQQLRENEPGNLDYTYLAGVLSLHEKKYTQAEDLLKKVVETDPLSAGAYYYLGEVNLAQEDFASAKDYFNEALAFDDFDVQSHFNLGTIYLFEDLPDEAIRHYARVIAEEPGNESAFIGLVNAYASKGYFTKGADKNGGNVFRFAVPYNPQQEIVRSVKPAIIALLNDGTENVSYVKKIGFYGAAIGKRRRGINFIELLNGGFSDWSSMGIDTQSFLDLRDREIVFHIQGAAGGEHLLLNIRDSHAAADAMPVNMGPQEITATDEWQEISFVLNDIANEIDLAHIVHIGVEFGTSTTRNTKGTQIKIKDIFIQ